MRYSQQLVINQTPVSIQNYLHNGAKLVWIQKNNPDSYDAVFETSAPEPELDAAAIVNQFLNSISPAALEKAMLEGSDMSQGVGASALAYLYGLVRVKIDAS